MIIQRGIIPYLGTKRKHIEFILNMLPIDWNKTEATYIEPFLGSGIVFQNIRPNSAILSDASPYLMGVFQSLQASPETFLQQLKDVYRKNSRDAHAQNKLDIMKVDDVVVRSALYAFLQRTTLFSFTYPKRDGLSFSGSYNSTGKPLAVDEDLWKDMAEALSGDTMLLTGDFADTMDMAKPGDLLFLDPPYIGTGSKAFRFSLADNDRLIDSIRKSHEKGCHLMLFNHTGYALPSDLSSAFVETPVPCRHLNSAFNNYKESLFTNYVPRT
jgi:DNA adenine methylase